MKKALRAVFTKIEVNTYGPQKANIVYSAVGTNGVTYRVSRHHWTLPTNGWGWKAVPIAPLAASNSFYEMTLVDIAWKLGILTAEMES